MHIFELACGKPRYAVDVMGLPSDQAVPKAVRQKIYNCANAYRSSNSTPADFASSLKESGVAPYGAVDCSKRYRVRGSQGAPLKCALFQYELLQQFIDFRKSVSARIWPKQVLKMGIAAQALIRARYKKWGRTPPDMPCLDLGKKGRKWLGRWKRRHGISFKKVNRKFKVSKKMIMRRSKTTWLNAWAAMLVYKLLFGEARLKMGMRPWPYHSVRDQMGRMLNEAESRNAPTLTFVGTDDGCDGLKTDHSQSRQRASLFTMVSDDPDEERGLDICFKLSTDRRIKDVEVPAGVPITLNFSKSGSYDLEACLRYFDRWIPKWSEARAKIFDYRVIHLDDYAVHNMDRVKQFLWDRGFLKDKIGGGCTYALCGCDTDLHSDMQRDYMEIDMEWAAAELTKRPWAVPVKTRQGFVDDWACIWTGFPHARRGKDSFLYNGIGGRPPERIVRADGGWSPLPKSYSIPHVP